MSRSAPEPTSTTMDLAPPRLTFGRFIRHLREQRDWNQEQLRDEAGGLGSGTVSKIENDEGERKQSTIEALAKAFGFKSSAELLIAYEQWNRGETVDPQPVTPPSLNRRRDDELDPEAKRLALQIQKLSRRARLHVEALILAWEEAESADDTKSR